MVHLDTQHSDASGAHADVEFLSFRLGDEEYAVDILQVQELRGHSAITPIPNSPGYVRGMMNLRGMVVPIIGLRERFGMPPLDYDKFTVIVVVKVAGKVIGMVVDAVTDVLKLQASDVDAVPKLGHRVDTTFITGMAKAGERLVIVLDVARAVGDACRAVGEGERN